MLIELHFTVNSAVTIRPEIAIFYNNELKISNVILDDCGTVDDITAKTKNIAFELSCNIENHHIKIQSLNISDEYKTTADFGFQLRHVIVDGVDMGVYGLDHVCINPVNESYIENVLTPANKLNELGDINGVKAHITKGHWANYVNMSGGWIEFEFQTPLYYWILKEKFGRQLESQYLP